MHINWDNAPEWATHYDDATGEFFSDKQYDLNCYSFPRPEKSEPIKQKRPYAQPNAQRRSIYTDDEAWAKLKAMGKGNASAGIREAVRKAEENQT